MGRKRYTRLRESEAAGSLNMGDSPQCPQCGRVTVATITTMYTALGGRR